MDEPKTEYLSLSAAAGLVGCCPATLINWYWRGKLPEAKVSPTGYYYVPADAVPAIRKRMGQGSGKGRPLGRKELPCG